MANVNNGIDLLNSLRLELNELERKKLATEVNMQKLNQQIALKESRLDSLERSLQESERIADEIEQKANALAESILLDAEVAAANRKAEIFKIEQEMILLQEELNSYSPNPAPASSGNNEKESNSSRPPIQEINIGLGDAGEKTIFEPESTDDNNLRPLPWKKNSQSSGDDSIYNMNLVSFVNARHFVTFGGKAGPVHAHSWQVEVEVQVPQEIGETIEFTKVFKAVTGALGVYENTILNQVHPFHLIQPTTENIALYFYNRVDEVLSELGLGLAQLNLWETPTRGIQVNNHNYALDEEISRVAQFEQESLEAAAAIDEPVFTDDEIKQSQVDENQRVIPQISVGHLRPAYSIRQYFIAAAIIFVVSIILYNNILWPPIEQRYPWGSDSWGHLYKAEMLYEQIQNGNYYPQFTEYWYNGTQPFRYWAPLPYYVLAFLRGITGDIFTAGNLYIYLGALLGALSWLFLSRRMGLWQAVMAGLVWLLWQDNVRVAFSEGNLPRVLATALLPLLFVLFFKTLVNRKSYIAIIGTLIMIQLVVLCHAMIAAVYCVCLFLFALFLWVFQGSSIEEFVQGILLLFAGIATAAWWLLPSLTGGGIAGIDPQAVREIVQFVAAGISLNPFYRFTNIETFYWGISLITALVICMASWKSRPAWARSAAVCGIILIIITFPLLRAIYISLPLSHLLWPLRFSSFAALAVLIACFTFNPAEERQQWLKSPYINGVLILSLFVFLMADCFVSFRLLAHTGTKPFDIIQSGELIKQEPGWRVATIDLSQLGSAPSYTFSEFAGLEQVFGWAWQGAVTSRNIMLLNTGLENQYYSFLFRSCVDLGATDLVVKEDVVTDLQAFRSAAALAGYEQRSKLAGISVWRNVEHPYLVEKQPQCLVIGKYAGTIALQFPEVEMALTPYIDQFSLNKLQEYSMIILSGASWKSKSNAEKLIKDYLILGGEVFVEMAGMPENVLAKQPEFLGVFGEPVSVRGEIEVWGKDSRVVLPPVWQQKGDWRAYVPMGLDEVELEFSYYGNQAPILGYKLVEGHKVWFLGYNLSYHAMRTGESSSARLLRDIIDLPSHYTSSNLILLEDYETSEKGYHMSCELDKARTVIVPVSHIDGIVVKLDGQKITHENYENLIKLQLPAGKHSLDIVLEQTKVYKWGKYLSLFFVMLIAAGLFYMKRTGDKN